MTAKIIETILIIALVLGAAATIHPPQKRLDLSSCVLWFMARGVGLLSVAVIFAKQSTSGTSARPTTKDLQRAPAESDAELGPKGLQPLA